MATTAPIYLRHSHAEFHIQRVPPDEILFINDHHQSSPSSTTFLIRFSLRNFDRFIHYSASPSQQDGYQILSVRTEDEPFGFDASTLMAVPLHRLTSVDVWTALSSEFLRVFHLPECCHVPILTGLYSHLSTISIDEDLHSGGGRNNRTHRFVRVEVGISRVLRWRSNRTRLISELNQIVLSTRRRVMLQRVKKEELDLMDCEDCSCAICLEELITGKEEEVEVLRLPCSHVFHGSCVLEWLKRRNSCPLCRLVLPFAAFDL